MATTTRELVFLNIGDLVLFEYKVACFMSSVIEEIGARCQRFSCVNQVHVSPRLSHGLRCSRVGV